MGQRPIVPHDDYWDAGEDDRVDIIVAVSRWLVMLKYPQISKTPSQYWRLREQRVRDMED